MCSMSNNFAQLNEPADIRCGCGQLMAKLTDQGLEIKCKRCKQVVVIPLNDFQPKKNRA